MLRQLGMIGVTFRRGGQQAVARFTLPSDPASDATLRALHTACGFLESVYLATCNRVEIVFIGQANLPIETYRQRVFHFFNARDADVDGVADGRVEGDAECQSQHARRALHAYEADGAAEHLFCVTAALDAMTVGETQILGQVKQAYQRAHGLGLVGRHLNVLFHDAFHAAKQVRTHTSLGRRRVSMMSLVAECIRERLQPAGVVVGSRVVPKCIALVGAGDMTVQCAELCGKMPHVQLLFVNRTVARAMQLAQRFDGGAMALSEFLHAPPKVDVIVTATGASEPIMTTPFFTALQKQTAGGDGMPLVVDLAVPRDVAKEAAAHAGVQLVDVDRLEHIAARNRNARRDELAEARVIIDDAVHAWRKRMVDRTMAPVIQTLRQRYDATLAESMQQLTGRLRANSEMAQIDADAIARMVHGWAQQMLNRVAHVPMVGLKRLANEHGLDAVEAFLAGVDEHVMQTNKPLIIATRGSALALVQTRDVAARLAKAGIATEVLILKTQGDREQVLSFDKMEGKGFFTKELEDALLRGDADIAVHSLKDLPTDPPNGLDVAAISVREDPRECLLVRKASVALDAGVLPVKYGGVIGTSAARRKGQIHVMRPDLITDDLRGNVPTRVNKLRDGRYDGIVVAYAGLKRLNLDLSDLHVQVLDVHVFVPAPAQGALGIQIRADDARARDAVKPLHADDSAGACVRAERDVLARLDGGCHLPFGAHARVRDGQHAEPLEMFGFLIRDAREHEHDSASSVPHVLAMPSSPRVVHVTAGDANTLAQRAYDALMMGDA